MLLLDYEKNEEELGFINENFHFSFSKKYADFIKAENGKLIIIKFFNILAPIVIRRAKFLITIQFQFKPLTVSGKELGETEEKLVLIRYIRYIKSKRLGHRIIQPTNFCIFNSYLRTTKYCEFGTYQIKLSNYSEEEILANMQARYRTSIRAAKKLNPEIRVGQKELVPFWNLHKETMLRTKMFYEPLDELKDFSKSLSDNCLIANVYLNNEILGGVFFAYNKYGAYYLHGASSNNDHSDGIIKYLHYWCMCHFKQENVVNYDFVGARTSDVGGTKLQGIQNFKRRFGSELRTGYLWKKDISVIHCFVYDFLLYLKFEFNASLLPTDIIDSEVNKINLRQNVLITNPISKNINRINKIISKKITEVNKVVRKYKKPIDQISLQKSISKIGIQKGDTLLIHSSLSKIGNVHNGPKTVIDSFIESVGNTGNIIMPAYSYINSMLETSKMDHYVFKAEENKSVTGIITETFRKYSKAKRSIHPTHSMAAIGPDAEYITEGHLNAKSNFGEGTPFHRIRELKGKIVGVGISIGPLTIYHSIEDFYPDKFKNVYFPKPVPIKVDIDGEIIYKKIDIHNPHYHNKRIDKDTRIETWFRNHLLKKGILHEGEFGDTKIWWMDIQTLFNELLLLKEKGITIYNVPNP